MPSSENVVPIFSLSRYILRLSAAFVRLSPKISVRAASRKPPKPTTDFKIVGKVNEQAIPCGTPQPSVIG